MTDSMSARNRMALHLSMMAMCIIATPIHAIAQSRTQVEQTLQQMTPEDIDKKLKELGITREEAIQRAQALGINLDQYLSRISPTSVPPGGALPSFTPQEPMRVVATPKEAPAVVKKAAVPGFAGRTGIDESIQPYGYDMFAAGVTAFEPTLNIATPSSYLLGPGDEIALTVWGETKLNYQLNISRDGNLVVPDVGPVSANGMTIVQFRDKLLRRMTAVYSGLKNGAADANTFLDVSLGKLRTIQVFILGEVQKPGGYLVSSMATALNALYSAGGPTTNGSLRNIQIVRGSENLPSVDLYDYLLRGDRSRDFRLQDGDVLFVKPVGKRVAVVGHLLRPAVYELKDKENLSDAIELSGGLLFDSYFNRVHIERVVPFSERKLYSKDLLDFDLKFESLSALTKSSATLQSGDIITVFRISDRFEQRVSITGNVNKPGPFQLKRGMRIRDLILEADSLRRNTFLDRGTLLRLRPDGYRREIVAFDVAHALAGLQSDNFILRNEDSVIVYQESQFYPVHPVTIEGSIRRPGVFTRNENMTMADLVVLAGGLREDASYADWEVSRMDTTKVGVYSRIYHVQPPRNYWENTVGSSFVLQDFDIVFVPPDPKYTPQKTVKISGYVTYPGTYAIRSSEERLADIFRRAGGLKLGAYLDGSHLLRKRMQVPIDFKQALDDQGSRDNVTMIDGDSISVAYQEDIVYVSGEVFVPSPILYKKGASVSYYVKQAGGFRETADEDRVATFLPGGKKWESSGFFLFPDPEILPGSSILVPKKVEKPSETLAILRDWSTILASLAAITIAMIQVSRLK